MALPDWSDMALNDGRRVINAFDGDVARKEPVQKAATALSAYLGIKAQDLLRDGVQFGSLVTEDIA